MSTNYDKKSVITELLAWAKIPCDISEFEAAHVKSTSPRLYESAEELFGSWQLALAAALLEACMDEPEDDDDEVVEQVPFDPASRVVSPHAGTRVLFGGLGGELVSLPLPSLTVSLDSQLVPLGSELPIAGELASVDAKPEDDSFVALSAGGEVGNLIAMQFTAAAQAATGGAVKLRQRLSGLSAPAELVSLMPRRSLRLNERIVAVSRGGQIKSSKASEYASRVGSDALPMILPKEGDQAGWLLALDERDEIMIASSAGRAIVFPMSEVRAQGLKAQGVRAISLDDGASVVGAFGPGGYATALLVTRQGFAKRIVLSSFRAQGRGGAGMQTARLNAGDEVAVVTPIRDEDDALIITSQGRYLRVPALMVPLMGRPARGERVALLDEGEEVRLACAVPAGQLTS